MSFRWYGTGNDSVSLSDIKQIPGVEEIVWALHHKQPGEVWEKDEIQKVKDELDEYYRTFHGQRQVEWKDKLGDDLNWALSFDNLPEKETTKHVHRLHPYKGKFIPQLVEYFLDGHTDEFKDKVYFRPGDIVLDPFAGSGTTLVQANEMGINAIGIENMFLDPDCGLRKVDLPIAERKIKIMTDLAKELE